MSPKKVIGLLYREIRGLHEAAYLLAFFTFASQLFALIRDRLLAHSFGAGETLDVFYAAFRIPDTLYAILASVVSLFVLIPFIERAQRKGGDEALRDFLSQMFSFFSGALLISGAVLWVCAPSIIALLYNGFSLEMREELVTVTRIMLLQPLLLGISNLFVAYVQVRGRFLLYAVAPIVYNMGIIFGILVLYPFFQTAGLGLGVVLGALLHLSVQIPFMIKNNMLPRFVMPSWRTVYEVVAISIPRSISLSMQQLVSLFMVSIISLYAVGSVSSFSFAWNLHAVPLSIIGVSYSVAAFPKLAKLFSEGKLKEYKDMIIVAVRQILFLSIPAVVFIIVLRAQIVRVVLGSGEFDWDATMMTSALLALLVVSLVAQSIIVLLVRACYAGGNTKTPLVINALSAIGTVGTTLFLLHFASTGVFPLEAFADMMKVSGVLSPEVLLVALAYSLGSFLNAFALLVYFEYRYRPFFSNVLATCVHSIIASLVAGIGVYLALHLLSDIVSMHTLPGILVQGFMAGVIGACFWVASLVTMGNKDVVVAWHVLEMKVKNLKVRDARGTIEGL